MRVVASNRLVSALARRLWRFGFLALCTTIVGTVGFRLIESWDVMESLYMTVITISSVGFKEVQPLSPEGRVFTIFLIIIGVGNVAYLFGTIGEFVVSDQLSGSIRRRKMRQTIDKTLGHYIICGFGRVGEQVASDLKSAGATFVIVENNPDRLDGAPEDYLRVEGDASDDEILNEAGIKKAAGLVAVTGEDALNTFVTLSARSLNSDLIIVARSNDKATDSKLLRAGANRVISPYIISGRSIATQLLNPTITRFLDGVMPTGTADLWMEGMKIDDGCFLDGKTLANANVHAVTGSFILALRRGDETVIANPQASIEMLAGDTLIAFGTREQLNKLQELAGPETTANVY